MGDWSLNEKTLLATLLAVGVTAIYYFERVLVVLSNQGMDSDDFGPTAITALVMLIVIEGIYHAIMAKPTDRESDDERDRAIRLRGASTEALVLTVGVMATIGHIVVASTLAKQEVQLFLVGNLLMAVLVAAELAGRGRELWHYRRGL